jgi:hypothetical protein
MTRSRVMIGACCAMLALAASPLAKGEEAPPEPRLWAVYTEYVKPSMVAEYEAVCREMIAAMKAAKVESRLTYFTVLQGESFSYVAVTPMESFADMDRIRREWMQMGEKVGKAAWAELIRRGSETVDHSSMQVFVERPEISYLPDTPRLEPEEAAFAEYGFHYLVPGMEQEAATIAGEYADLYRKNGLAESFTVLQAVTGEDLPLLVVTTYGKDEADWIAAGTKVNEALGEEGLMLQQRAMRVIRTYESKKRRLREELSYRPPREIAGEAE